MGSSDGEPGRAARPVVSPELVGRDRQLAALVAAVSAPPAVVVVEGEAGIGKTRLVTELRHHPDLASSRFLVGACRGIRELFPLGAVIEAVRGLGDDPTGPLPPVTGALRPLLPELADRLPQRPEPLDDRAGEWHRVFRGLVALLGTLGPAVLVLEDLHWADELTADFASYLLGDLPTQLSLVLTYRGEDAAGRIRALTARLPAGTGHAHVALPPLDPQQTGELAAAVLAVDRVPAEFAAHLCERASGLPFAVEELLRLLQIRGTVIGRGGRRSRQALNALAVPAGIRDSVRERADRLSPAGRVVVEAAAVLQVPHPVPVLAAVGRIGADQAGPGVREGLAAGLLSEQGAAVGFRHPLATQAAYDDLPHLRRRELHTLAAATLTDLDPTPWEQVAHHLRGAGRLGEWVSAVERAVDRAVELGHDEQAAQLLEDVLRQAPLTASDRGRIAVKLGQVATQTLHGRDLAGTLSTVLEQDLPKAARGELRFRLALLLDGSGDPVRQRQLCLDAVAELADRPDLRAWAMVGLGIPIVPGVSLPEHLSWLHRAQAVLPEVGDPLLQVFLRGKAAMVLVSVGDPRWRALADRILARDRTAPPRRPEVNACYSIAIEASYAGHHGAAGELLQRAAGGGAGPENRRLTLMLRSAGALLDYCQGGWDGLPERVAVLADQLTDYPPAQIDVAVVAGCLALARGDLSGARQGLVDALESAERLGAFSAFGFGTAALARLEAARGEPAAAAASVDRLLATLEPPGIWLPLARALPGLVEGLLAAGRERQAIRLMSDCARRLSALDAPLASAALRHARGVLAADAGRWLSAARHCLAAAASYERLRCPYEAAQAQELAAGSRFAAGAAGGGPPLLAALASYRRLGATWDEARATRIARRHRVRLPARYRGGRRGYGDQLSPRERQVGELAATGRTNKEIARELFLSPKTVDKHLRAALRKLGLRSRTALAHRLAAARPRPVPTINGAFAALLPAGRPRRLAR